MAALARLQQVPQPTMPDHASRNGCRALARASVGAGNGRAALKWDGAFLEFGSQVRQCGRCHTIEGSRDTSFFRQVKFRSLARGLPHRLRFGAPR